jgi:hypothetical protein
MGTNTVVYNASIPIYNLLAKTCQCVLLKYQLIEIFKGGSIMGHVTEQKIVEAVVQGGNQIQVHALKLSNYNLHPVLTAAADLIKGILECDSANSHAQMSPNDAQMIKLGWDRVKVELGLAQEFKEMAKGAHEREHYVTVPIDNEVATAINIQCGRLGKALLNFIYVGIGADSAKMQFWMGPKLGRDIQKALEHVDRIIEVFVADGGETAQEMPEFATGTLVPGTNLGAVSLREPSSLVPAAGVPDAPDNPSIAPEPGDRQPSS